MNSIPALCFVKNLTEHLLTYGSLAGAYFGSPLLLPARDYVRYRCVPGELSDFHPNDRVLVVDRFGAIFVL
jgi:hypothetical protein